MLLPDFLAVLQVNTYMPDSQYHHRKDKPDHLPVNAQEKKAATGSAAPATGTPQKLL